MNNMNNNLIKRIEASIVAFTLTTFIINAENNCLTINDIFDSDSYMPYTCDYTSSIDGESYYINNLRQIVSFDYATGKNKETIIDLDEIKDCPIEKIDGFSIARDNNNVLLLYTNAEQIYRNSFEAEYYTYNIHYKELKKVADDKIQNAIIAPNGWLVAFVRDNNIFIKKLKYDSESPVTNDGAIGQIINGIPDWVNEEEFALTSAMEWSDDSKELAFIKYDETNVKSYEFALYKTSNPSLDEYSLYPGKYSYKYPKAGEINATTNVCVYNVDNRKVKTIDLDDKKDYYIPRIIWTHTPNELCICKLNRRQNRLDVLIANTATTICRSLYSDTNERYIDSYDYSNTIFLPDGQNVVCVSERNGYRHIYLYGINGVEKGQLTSGNWDVDKICGFEPTSKTLIFTAAKNTPLEKDIFAINIDKKNITPLSKGGGSYSASLSSSGKYFIKYFSSSSTPPTYSVCDIRGTLKYVIEDNEELSNNLKNINFFKKEFKTFTNSNGDNLNYWIVKPNNFDPSIKYPVLLVQYSGPSSQEVKNEWDIDWEQALAAEGYIVACVDPRGTDFRGETFRKCSYLKLGKYESDDQIEFAKYLSKQSFIDANRIGIWGWSFGGFTTTLCLCKSDIFKIGIAVAPVTDWRFYDTIYTERYLRTPEENSSGYDANSPLLLASNLNGRLFLIQGAADDNVHLQNQMEFVDALAIAGKQFDMFTYPNRNHNICGGPILTHLYTMMLNYVKRNL